MGENEKNVLEQLRLNLASMQKQLDALTQKERIEEAKEISEETEEKSGVSRELSESLASKDKEYVEAMKKVSSDVKRFVSSWHTIFMGENIQICSSCTSMIDGIHEINEDIIATALEPFTNPKRILILKALFFTDLSGAEISMKTGCVGGQLYHHLNNLENAGLIEKRNEKFGISEKGKSILITLHTIVGAIKTSDIPAEKQIEYANKNSARIGNHIFTVKGIEIPSKPDKPTSPDSVPNIIL